MNQYETPQPPSPPAPCSARRWMVRVHVKRGFTCCLFTFKLPATKAECRIMANDWIADREVSEIYVWPTQPGKGE